MTSSQFPHFPTPMIPPPPPPAFPMIHPNFLQNPLGIPGMPNVPLVAPTTWVPPTVAPMPFVASLPLPIITNAPSYPAITLPVTTTDPPASESSPLNSYFNTVKLLEGPLLNEKPHEKILTCFIYNLPENILDISDITEHLANLCGPIQRWKRLVSSNGKFKNFGFCEFQSADGLMRALRLFPSICIDGKWLDIITDSSSKEYLDKFQGTINQYLAVNPSFQAPLQYDEDVKESMRSYLSTRRLNQFSVNEKRPNTSLNENLQALKQNGHTESAADEEEEGAIDQYLEGHLRAEEERLEHLFRERLKKWETRELALQKERQREEDRLEDERFRKLKMKEALAKFVERFDLDEDLPPLYELEKKIDFSLIPDGFSILDYYYKRDESTNHYRYRS